MIIEESILGQVCWPCRVGFVWSLLYMSRHRLSTEIMTRHDMSASINSLFWVRDYVWFIDVQSQSDCFWSATSLINYWNKRNFTLSLCGASPLGPSTGPIAFTAVRTSLRNIPSHTVPCRSSRQFISSPLPFVNHCHAGSPSTPFSTILVAGRITDVKKHQMDHLCALAIRSHSKNFSDITHLTGGLLEKQAVLRNPVR